MSEANNSVDRLVRPLNEKQKKALEQLSPEWAVAPLRVHISTLMSLQNRGLAECKMVKAWQICLQLGYKSGAYHWRRKAA